MDSGAKRIQNIVLSLRNFSRLDESGYKAVDIHEGIESTLLLIQHRLEFLNSDRLFRLFETLTTFLPLSVMPAILIRLSSMSL